jgi:hypothetical protein
MGGTASNGHELSPLPGWRAGFELARKAAGTSSRRSPAGRAARPDAIAEPCSVSVYEVDAQPQQWVCVGPGELPLDRKQRAGIGVLDEDCAHPARFPVRERERLRGRVGRAQP